MKLIIAGSRTISYGRFFLNILVDKLIPNRIVTEIVSGTARGVDRDGEEYAGMNNLKLTKFPADWDTNGRSAGYIRNGKMADYADALLLVWDGRSRGSANMKKQMEKRNKPVYEIIIKEPQNGQSS